MKPRAFVLMPFAKEFDDVYDYLIRSPVSEAGFDVIRADDILNQRNILEDVVQSIINSDLIIADLSTANPNVYYELGLAHAFGRRVILLAQSIEEVPFDLRSYRIVTYSTHFSKMNEARDEVLQLANRARLGKVQFGSPISDFGARIGVTLPIASDLPSLALKEAEDDRGLLDFQEELEENIGVVTEILVEVGNRLTALTPEIQSTGERLTAPETGAPKRRRKIIRGLASSLDKYSEWLQENNGKYRKALGHIGESLNAMLSGEFEIQDEAKKELREFIKTIHGVEKEAQKGRDGFSDLTTTLDTLPRIEKEFNRSRRRLSEELKGLTDNVDQTISVLARARHASSKFLEDED